MRSRSFQLIPRRPGRAIDLHYGSRVLSIARRPASDTSILPLGYMPQKSPSSSVSSPCLTVPPAHLSPLCRRRNGCAHRSMRDAAEVPVTERRPVCSVVLARLLPWLRAWL